MVCITFGKDKWPMYNRSQTELKAQHLKKRERMIARQLVKRLFSFSSLLGLQFPNALSDEISNFSSSTPCTDSHPSCFCSSSPGSAEQDDEARPADLNMVLRAYRLPHLSLIHSSLRCGSHLVHH